MLEIKMKQMHHGVWKWILKWEKKDSLGVPELLRARQCLTQRKSSSVGLTFPPPNSSRVYDPPDIARWQKAKNNDTFSPSVTKQL